MNEHEAELREALRRLPAPEPSPDLLQRILRSRAMGVRVTLPAGGLAVPWRWIGVAAAVAILIGGSWFVSLSLSELGNSRAVRDPLNELLRGTPLWPSIRDASESPGKPARPKYALILAESLDPSRLSEGVWTYRSTTTTDGILTEPSFIGGTRIRMARVNYDGNPAWMVTTATRFRHGRWGEFSDTLYLDAATLRPRYAVVYGHNRRTRTVQSFSSDSGTQSVTITQPMEGFYSAAMELPFPPQAVFTSDWSLYRFRVLLPAFPLARRWQGSMYQTSFFRAGPRTLGLQALPLDLRVVGRENVSVPVGTFDCWRVEMENRWGQTQLWTLWVSRDHGVLIKAQLRWSDRVHDEVLETFEPEGH